MKYITFSYDDSVPQDVRLVELFNKYHITGTFNINSLLEEFPGSRRLTPNEQVPLYQGHEVCGHTLHHYDLTILTKEEIRKEVFEDKQNIETIFQTPCTGFAYPFGTTNQTVVEVLKEVGIKHARTVVSTNDFTIPAKPFELVQTTHHKNPDLFALANKFLELDGSNQDYLFSIWGHSYEFTQENTPVNFEKFEEFLKLISNKEDIRYLGITDTLTQLKVI